ncbi:MAG: glycosyltransferase [Chloroflexi bacterium]|nr:glycosyltransferase [Chloroflexota bacterium]MCI0579680.1 glycosyltransferase [Chloroflexota bacterium]MCI0645880.1 glycosyltransferase [Chloroflexota bacterium]MCI0725735.1 glycosyltransferase [Chloroflexota bacterium]
MRILFIVSQDPLSPHYRGGSSAIYYEQLASLAALGHDVYLWHFAYPHKRPRFDEFVASDAEVWSEVQAMCAWVAMTTMPYPGTLWDRAQNKVATLLSGEDVVFPTLRTAGYSQLKGLVAKLRPDLIWAQHFWAAQVAVLQKEIPVVFSHIDWLYRIKALRGRGHENGRMQRAEERVARQSAAVVSGSSVECEELRQLGCRHVAYIPVAYRPFDLDFDHVPADLRLVHFGGLATTATRVGLERFFEVVWPALAPAERPQFYAAGDTSTATPALQQHLAQVVCTGHVTDWPAVLRPYDLHLIPWEHSTGQRTRLPVAFNFGQVVVAVRAGVAGFPEAEDGVNCRLVERLEEMAGVIRELAADPDQRLRLGRAARQTFDSHFTRAALLPRYEQVIKAMSDEQRAMSSNEQ